ncbi:uncharacterized protein [Epargyreus clarus]|uniref:uncharacterized protein n=1 Tax=Epargyreus clarus TaxID=520877 RepID=UPI003C2FB93E
MSSAHSEQSARPGRAAGAAGEAAPLHARSFKLRFAAQCELGRSHISAVKPLALPATVTDKFYRRSRSPAAPDAPQRLQRVQDMFRRGPRDKYDAPVTTSQEYGWWRASGGGARELRHGLRDSAWLKERVRVLRPDAGYRR